MAGSISVSSLGPSNDHVAAHPTLHGSNGSKAVAAVAAAVGGIDAS
jgi:hypothetical protein